MSEIHHPYDAQHQTELEELVDLYLNVCAMTRDAFQQWLADTPAHRIERFDDAKVALDQCRRPLLPRYDRGS
jgi:hypothetical protein